jgi:hypothetical protein
MEVDLCGIGEIVPNTILRLPLTSGRGWVQLHLRYRSTTSISLVEWLWVTLAGKIYDGRLLLCAGLAWLSSWAMA